MCKTVRVSDSPKRAHVTMAKALIMADLHRHLRHAVFALSVILLAHGPRQSTLIPLIPAQLLPTSNKTKADKIKSRSADRLRKRKRRRNSKSSKLEQQIQQKIQQFNCDRRPSAVLKVWATPPGEKKEKTKKDEEKTPMRKDRDRRRPHRRPPRPSMRPGMAMRDRQRTAGPVVRRSPRWRCSGRRGNCQETEAV